MTPEIQEIVQIHTLNESAISRHDDFPRVAFYLLGPRGTRLYGRTIRKVMGGEGNFRAVGIVFRYQIPCMNFFLGHSMNIF